MSKGVALATVKHARQHTPCPELSELITFSKTGGAHTTKGRGEGRGGFGKFSPRDNYIDAPPDVSLHPLSLLPVVDSINSEIRS